MNWRGLLCLLAGLFVSVPASAKLADTIELDQAGFTRLVTDFLAVELGKDACVKLETSTSLLFGSADEGCRNRLETTALYAVYASDPNVIDLKLGKIARQIAADLKSIEQPLTAQQLVSVLRGANSVQAYLSGEKNAVIRPFAGDIVEVLMIDRGDRLLFATEADLAALQLDAPTAFETGRAQLKSHLGQIAGQTMHQVSLQSSSAGLGSGIPLLSGACSANTTNAYWYVFDRNLVMKADETNAIAVANLLRLVNQARADKTAYSETVLLCQSGRWAIRKQNGEIHFASASDALR